MKPMDKALCMTLYGDAFAVERDGKVYGWYPTAEAARAAADMAGDDVSEYRIMDEPAMRYITAVSAATINQMARTAKKLWPRRRYGRAMHRAIRRHRERVLIAGLRFVAADDPNYTHVHGWAFPKGASRLDDGTLAALTSVRAAFEAEDAPA